MKRKNLEGDALALFKVTILVFLHNYEAEGKPSKVYSPSCTQVVLVNCIYKDGR
jgi:hypothetical protein